MSGIKRYCRFKGWDYSKGSSLFITIATAPHRALFGRVVKPDHVHFNCCLKAGLKGPLKVLGFAIRHFKNYTTKLAKRSVCLNLNEEIIKIATSKDGLALYWKIDGPHVLAK